VAIKAVQVLLGWEQRALDLLFPRRCVTCGADGAWICPGCGRDLFVETPNVQALSGAPVFSLLPFELLAHEVGALLGAPVWPQALSRGKGGTQVGHTASERKERVSSLFSWSGLGRCPAYENRTWVVLDDVLTTGATLSACLELVSANGGVGPAGLTVAWKSRAVGQEK
jgi:predicted amidophosphoribosyltransferase